MKKSSPCDGKEGLAEVPRKRNSARGEHEKEREMWSVGPRKEKYTG
jgi:hypothetical protein